MVILLETFIFKIKLFFRNSKNIVKIIIYDKFTVS